MHSGGKMTAEIFKHKRSLFFTVLSVFSIGVLVLAALLLNPANTVDTMASAGMPPSGMPVSQALEGNKAPSENTLSQKDLPLNSPFELAETGFVSNGKNMTLKLWMTEGTHVTNAELGPFGTDYYTGNLVGEVYDQENRLICSNDLSRFFTEKLIFRNKFNNIFTDDYNGDGRRDFTVGQYVSSNYHAFNIFTIKENGQIEKLPVKDNPDGIVCSNFDEYYSTGFLKTTGKGIKVTIYDMEKGKNIEKYYSWTGNEFINVDHPTINENQLDKTKNRLKDGGYIKSKDLILKLDKSDETVKYMLESFPEKIKVGSIYEGSFTGSGKKELLVIFKFSGLPHAGGLDSSAAGIFDRNKLSLISQKTFITDEAQFELQKDAKGRQYLVYSGTVTYQGHSTSELQVLKLFENWGQLLPEYSIFSGGQYKYQIRDDGLISVLEPVFEDNDVVDWDKRFYLKWNTKTAALEDFIPETFKDSKNENYFSSSSVSPDGKYALVSHEWGFDENSYILVYDKPKNKFLYRYDILGQDFSFNWSKDSKKVVVGRAARVWIDTCIIEMGKPDYISMLDNNIAGYEEFKASGARFDYELNESRPDPYIQLLDWSPDNKKLLLHYQWTDREYTRQSGTFVYDLEESRISEITQNAPEDEGWNLEPQKPEGFKW